MAKETLTTTSEVMHALGGFAAVAELTGRKYSATWNWSKANNFPANTYVILTAALRKRGKRAPASLWKMDEPQLCETAGEGEY